MLIAGTAGGGKTYHCRALWTRLGGDSKAWAAKGNVKELRLADGPLGRLHQGSLRVQRAGQRPALQRLERSVLGGDDSEIVILAANHLAKSSTACAISISVKAAGIPCARRCKSASYKLAWRPTALAVIDLSRTTTKRLLRRSPRQWQRTPHGTTAPAAP